MEVDVNNAVSTYAVKEALQLQKDQAENITKMVQQSKDIAEKSVENKVKSSDSSKGQNIDLQA